MVCKACRIHEVTSRPGDIRLRSRQRARSRFAARGSRLAARGSRSADPESRAPGPGRARCRDRSRSFGWTTSGRTQRPSESAICGPLSRAAANAAAGVVLLEEIDLALAAAGVGGGVFLALDFVRDLA